MMETRAVMILASLALAVASTNPAPVAVIPPWPDRHADRAVRGRGGRVPHQRRRGSLRIPRRIDARHEPGRRPCVARRRCSRLPSTAERAGRPARIEQEERDLLAERIAGWAESTRMCPVEQTLVQGRAVTSLLDFASAAQLIFVGSHGRGGFTEMLRRSWWVVRLQRRAPTRRRRLSSPALVSTTNGSFPKTRSTASGGSPVRGQRAATGRAGNRARNAPGPVPAFAGGAAAYPFGGEVIRSGGDHRSVPNRMSHDSGR